VDRILAIVLALLAGGVGALCVSPSLTRVRQVVLRAPTAPDATGTVSVTVPPSAEPLTAIILRARGHGARLALRVSQDGSLLSRVDVPVDGERADVRTTVGLRPRATLCLSAASPDWSLEYLELATVFGFTSGIVSANVVAAGQPGHRGIPWWLAVSLTVVIAGMALTSRARTSWGQWFERVARGVVMAVFGAAVLSPVVSQYAIVFSLPTFLKLLALACGGTVVRHYLGFRAATAASHPKGARVVDSVTVVGLTAVFLVTVLLHGLAEHGGDYSSFLYMSEEFSHSPLLRGQPDARNSVTVHPSGYDGQFMYLIALDPFLTRLEPARYAGVADSPPYRYGRIGFSLLARCLTGGNVAALPRTMVWLVVAGHLLTVVFLVLIAGRLDAAPWQVLPYVLIPGLLVSLGRALPEPIAAALLLGGVWAYLGERRALAIVLWASSLLVRETGVVLVLAVCALELARKGTRMRALGLLVALVPATGWRLYVGWRLAPAFGWGAFWSDPGDLTLPLAGFLDLWWVEGAGEASTLLYPLLMVAFVVLGFAMWRVRPGPIAAAALAYALLGVSLTYEKIWVWLGNGERGTYEALLFLLVASFPAAGLPKGLRRGLFAAAVVLFVYTFQYATYASWFRAGLMVFD
jgi:hypothetical protein